MDPQHAVIISEDEGYDSYEDTLMAPRSSKSRTCVWSDSESEFEPAMCSNLEELEIHETPARTEMDSESEEIYVHAPTRIREPKQHPLIKDGEVVIKMGDPRIEHLLDSGAMASLDNLDNAAAILEKLGFVIVTDVFSQDECKDFVTKTAQMLTDISLGAAIEHMKTDPKESYPIWVPSSFANKSVCPPGGRVGMYCSIANGDHQWRIRMHPNVQKIFRHLYSDMVGADVGSDFFTSVDGMSFHPDSSRKSNHHWLHVDRTTAEPDLVHPVTGAKVDFIQGQCVFSNSQSSFVATPGGHLYYDQFMKHSVIPENCTNFHIFDAEGLETMAELMSISKSELPQQIHAPAGSMIFWLSATPHASKTGSSAPKVVDLSYGPAYEPPKFVSTLAECEELAHYDYGPGYDVGLFDGWRCVFYVCLSPKNMHPDPGAVSKRLKTAYEMNRATSHTGYKLTGIGPNMQQRENYQLDVFSKPNTVCNMYNYMMPRPTYDEVLYLLDFEGSNKRKRGGVGLGGHQKKPKVDLQ